MFRSGKNFVFSNLDSVVTEPYRIAPNDLIEFNMFTSDGFKLIDLTTTFGSSISSMGNTQFFIETDGFVKLPVVGRVQLSGMTTREAETFLEERFLSFYNKPFVLLNVSNKRVHVFNGAGYPGKVIELKNENTTLVEAIAQAGGINNSGKSSRIKLIRTYGGEEQVYLIDLSNLGSVHSKNVVLQANDIIYIEPVKRVSQTLLSEISPIIGILSSILLIVSTVK
jgi:polysaccharide biosynthesis/export protein